MAGWKFELGTNGKRGKLNISNLGTLKVRGQPRDWSKPTTLTLKKPINGMPVSPLPANPNEPKD